MVGFQNVDGTNPDFLCIKSSYWINKLSPDRPMQPKISYVLGFEICL